MERIPWRFCSQYDASYQAFCSRLQVLDSVSMRLYHVMQQFYHVLKRSAWDTTWIIIIYQNSASTSLIYSSLWICKKMFQISFFAVSRLWASISGCLRQKSMIKFGWTSLLHSFKYFNVWYFISGTSRYNNSIHEKSNSCIWIINYNYRVLDVSIKLTSVVYDSNSELWNVYRR